MDEATTLIETARAALSRSEATFSKVQNIGKLGNDRCLELGEKLESFGASYEVTREEVPDSVFFFRTNKILTESGLRASTPDLHTGQAHTRLLVHLPHR